ncbi:MAG: DUF2889 domain-containing protein [Spongiibacteraceae bacterium]
MSSSNAIASDLPSAPRNPAGPAPLRRPNSVRRTSSIDMTWPEGYGGRMHFACTGRDIFTRATGDQPLVLRVDTLKAEIGPDRSIVSIASEPPRAHIGKLVGARGGGYLRQALDEILPDERDAGSPLYLLIDDLSGTSLIAGWAWSRWTPDWLPKDMVGSNDDTDVRELRRARMENVCIGFRTGSSALDDMRGESQNSWPVEPLPNPEDSIGWHELKYHTDTSMRRARRIDVWLDDVVHIDATFQDSASLPTGGRAAIHEYKLQATADPKTLQLLSVVADPRILPYRECPSAAGNVALMVGTSLREMRTEVLATLRRSLGCTHLNDALRALAEVPILLDDLKKQTATR